MISLTLYVMLQHTDQNLYDFDNLNLNKVKIIINFAILNLSQK